MIDRLSSRRKLESRNLLKKILDSSFFWNKKMQGNLIRFIFLVWIISYQSCSFSASIWNEAANIGYWFYKEPIYKRSENKFQDDKVKDKSKCSNINTWSIHCGFVDPTKLGLRKEMAFSFEQKQYRELLKNFSMNSNDKNAVFEWQRFNDWAIAQAMAAAYVSEFNIAQHPELDSTIMHPFSQFGNLIIKNFNNAMRDDFFNMLSKSSLLVFFTRSNCNFCHYQSEIVKMLESKTHIPVWNASLDKNHLPNFNHYLVEPDTLRPAQYLHVSTVPVIFLYLAPQAGGGSQEHWIRLATGLTSADIIEDRILRFVQGYRQTLKPINHEN